MNFKNLLFCLTTALLLASCGGDPCDKIVCPTGSTPVEVSGECECQQTTTDPCDGVTCPTGFIATANGDNCNCVEDGTPTVGTVDVAGELPSGTVNWTKDNIYVLTGKVVVLEGTTLDIEAGTIIKAKEGTGTLASALIIARGGLINAVGTATEPIIFTSVTDDIMPGEILSPNLTEADNALWGGLIVLGRASVSVKGSDDTGQIEGIPADDEFGRYGGSDDDDSSGTLKYISVRHGGALIGDNNEINGITFGGVGRGTTVENIEVVANLDDGVEFFGGTVNVLNVVVANGEDDGLDIDQNYSGTITNAFVIQSGATAGDNALEIDGPEGTTHTTGKFTIKNITLIDEDGMSDTGGDLKSKAQGTIENASWRGFNNVEGDRVQIRASFQTGCAETSGDAYLNYLAGDLQIINSEWVGAGTFADWTNVYVDKDDVKDPDLPDPEVCPEPAGYDTNITNLLEAAAAGNEVNGTATKGADPAPFAGWSWTALNNKI